MTANGVVHEQPADPDGESPGAAAIERYKRRLGVDVDNGEDQQREGA